LNSWDLEGDTRDVWRRTSHEKKKPHDVTGSSLNKPVVECHLDW
jgi:hypothetical protein